MDFHSNDWRVLCSMHRPYEQNVTIIKKFNDDYYKLVTFNSLRSDGIELESDINKREKGSVNDQKLLNNITRARNTIFEIAMCNDWDFFITLTLSQEKLSKKGLDRYNLTEFYKFFVNWLHHLPYKVKYLLVPEQHKDGAWHFHGFISGIAESDLQLFSCSDNIPIYIKNKLSNGYKIFKWLSYDNKFGFCDLEYISDQERCSSYVTKYISKDLYKTINNLGFHCYYCSQGLKRAERILKDKIVLSDDFNYDFSNDFVSIKVLNSEQLQSLNIK